MIKLKEAISQTMERQKGVVFAESAIVYREMYSGRDIIAKNSRFEPDYTDERGYVPVEWWIVSRVRAENDVPKEGEGITNILLSSDGPTEVPGSVSFVDALNAADDLLLGEYRDRWPLAKVLDIGGDPITPSFGGSAEIPPIPFHTHAGDVVDGRVRPPGKLEAYFFLPVDVPPYNMNLGEVITRIGLKPDTTKSEVIRAMREFGVNDDMYRLGQEYPVVPGEGWTIRPGCLHAPGPWPTFELQLPQDDFHFVAWQLGQKVAEPERSRLWESLGLRGLKDEDAVLDQAIDYELSIDPDFKSKFHRPSQVLEEGTWGRRSQIFFDEFYGEAIEISPGATYHRHSTELPFAGIIWSGSGMINGKKVAAPPYRMEGMQEAPVDGEKGYNEFLCTPGGTFHVVADDHHPLFIYTFFPLLS